MLISAVVEVGSLDNINSLRQYSLRCIFLMIYRKNNQSVGQDTFMGKSVINHIASCHAGLKLLLITNRVNNKSASNLTKNSTLHIYK
jgi:hypothetical protein